MFEWSQKHTQRAERVEAQPRGGPGALKISSHRAKHLEPLNFSAYCCHISDRNRGRNFAWVFDACEHHSTRERNIDNLPWTSSKADLISWLGPGS